MFDPNSRYVKLPVESLVNAEGATVRYVSRRFLPQGEKMSVLRRVQVTAGDRIDSITGDTLGDPEQFWRVCDANNAMYPLELTFRPGRVLAIPVPGR